jgi:D-sedoheptulose 7-phosphate isomerase
MIDYKKNIQDYLKKEIEVINKLDIEELNKAMNAISEAWASGATIYSMGNGGSAATASHMACDFNKGISMEVGKKFHLICLTDNIPTMMAIANDMSYEDIFAMQLQDVVKKGDLVIAISGSGNSKNIIKAVTYAKSKGAKVIGLTGYNGGKLKELADYSMHVPVDDMQIAEDLHMIFDHMMMRVFCETGK